MLSLSGIVQVRVNAAAAVSPSTAFSTGLILAPSASAVSEENRCRPYASAADMLSDGFAATDPAYRAAAAYFAADPAPDRVYVGLYGPGETPAPVLEDILESTDDFYAVAACDDVPARVVALAESFPLLDRRIVLFCGAAGSVSDALAQNGLLRRVRATGSDRIVTVYGSDVYAAAAVAGTAMGLSRENPLGGFTLCYQEVPGMLPTDLTESEVFQLKAAGCNVYVTRGRSRRLLENGNAVSGRRFHEVYAMDRIAADLQEEALDLITSGPGKLPQTDETSAVFINRFSAVLAGYAAAGVLAPGIWRGNPAGSLRHGDVLENGYLLWADAYHLQSDMDRAAHKAMPVHCALCLSGSVETLVIDVDVSM